MTDLELRRPLRVRGSHIAQNIAGWLSRSRVTPNQISITSVVFATLAGGSLLVSTGSSEPLNSAMLFLAALFIQCRLLCNLFDGMVAIEGGKTTPAGELFNDLPDRIADPMILIAAGYAANAPPWGETLGWLAGLLAVMTAYVRTLSVSIGAPADFRGPMAKQHRMAIMTTACIFSIGEQFIWSNRYLLLFTLLIICAGSIVTMINRTATAYHHLEHRGSA